jgi:phosphate starvation-inducible membrane PsiE
MSKKLFQVSLFTLTSLMFFLISVLLYIDSSAQSSLEVASIIIMITSITLFFIGYFLLAALIVRNYIPKGEKIK